MAIVQISRVQHRRGLSSNLPRPNLAEGELGFTLDTGELFIGAPNFPPVVGRDSYPYQNLRILTEFSLRNLLSSLIHVYRYQNRNNLNFPGVRSYRANPAYTVEQLLQEKLDEVVSVKSYGALGDGTTDDSKAIKQACIDLYTESFSKAEPRILYFPAGVYVIQAESLPLFKGTRWVGDGKGRTVIFLSNNNVKAVAETAEWDRVRNLINKDIDILGGIVSDIFISGMTLARSNVGDILKLERAKRGTCLDVEFSVATLSEDKRLQKNISWNTNLSYGPWPASTKYDSTKHGICVKIDRLTKLEGSGDIVVAIDGQITNWVAEDFNFIDCVFKSNTYGFYLVDCVDNVNVVDCVFEDLFKGVTLGETLYYTSEELSKVGNFSTPFDISTETYRNWDPTGAYSGSSQNPTGAWGPFGFKVTNTTFRNILDTPFSVFSTRPGNMSLGNMYYRYGGAWSEASVPSERTPSSPAIYFFRDPNKATPLINPSANNIYSAKNNSSVGDIFDYTGTLPLRVSAPSIYNLINNVQDPISSPRGITLGTQHYTAMDPNGITLAGKTNVFAAQDQDTGIRFDLSTQNAIVIDYSIKRGNSVKTGEIHIVANTDLEIDWHEQVAEIGTPLVNINLNVTTTLVGVEQSPFIKIEYTDVGAAGVGNALLHWSARYWNHSYNDYS